MSLFERLAKQSDHAVVGLLMAGGLIYTLPFLNALEFFRHTEADRVLIAWEMLQRQSFSMPYLLGDFYLTKPPFYYWCLELVFWMTGSIGEWAARSVSALTYCTLIIIQFIFLRLADIKRRAAAISALILASCLALFSASVQAEIDMTFCLLTTCALYSGYLGFVKPNKFAWVLMSYLFLALGFLCKGPPALFFYASGVGLFGLYSLFSGKNRNGLAWLGAAHVAGVILLIGVIYAWVGFVLAQVSSEHVWFRLNEQIFERFIADPSAALRERGYFYYLGAFLIGLLPWTPLGYWSLRREQAETHLDLRLFSLLVVIPALVVFSLSSGKASRYILPLYPFAANILMCGALSLLASKHKVKFATCLVGGICLVFLARLPYSLVYAPLRNEKYSVKPMVEEISTLLPSKTPIYTVNLAQRWIAYYLTRANYQVLRLTPMTLTKLSKNDLVYLLLNLKEDQQILAQVSQKARTLKVVKNFNLPKDRITLVSIATDEVAYFDPAPIFPAVPQVSLANAPVSPAS